MKFSNYITKHHQASPSILRYFLAWSFFLMFSFNSLIFAQTQVCVFPDIPVSEILANKASFSNVAYSGPAPKFPIWLYLLRGDNGQSAHTIQDFSSLIPTLNGYFNGVVQFTICGTTIIDNEDYREMEVNTDYPTLINYINTLNEPNSAHCIRVFICDLIQAGAVQPEGYCLSPTSPGNSPIPGIMIRVSNSKVLGHELGHYFGLPHTFGNTSIQYIDDMVVVYGDTLTCYETGDGFCDTPADPGSCGQTSACKVSSCPVNDPIGKTYQPDPSLLMSLFLGCQTRFSPEQKSYMRGKIDGGINSDYAFLYTAPTECILPFGFVHRYCDANFNPDTIVYAPMKSLGIKIKNINSSVVCDKITGNIGEYESTGCNFSTSSRQLIPDKNYGTALAGLEGNDADNIIRHVTGLDGFSFTSPLQMIAADVNNSGTITSWDAQLIRQLIMGKISVLPAGNWRYLSEFWVADPAFATGFFDGNPFDAHVIQSFTNGMALNYLTNQGVIPNVDSWMDFINLDLIYPNALNEAAWSFYGIKVGDVDCTLLALSGVQNEPNELFLNVPTHLSTFIPKQTNKHLQVIANLSEPAVSWQLGIQYATDKLEILQTNNGNTGIDFGVENYANYVNPESKVGDFRTIGYSTNLTPILLNNKVLFDLNVKALDDIEKLEDVFQLSSKNIVCKFFDADGNEIENVSLSLNITNSYDGSSDRAATKVSKNLEIKTWPSPFHCQLYFSVKTANDLDAIISIYDMLGNLVAKEKPKLTVGENMIEVTTLCALPNGLYRFEIKAGEIFQSGKVVKH